MRRSTVAILLASAFTFAVPTVVAAQKGHGAKVKTNAPKAPGGGHAGGAAKVNGGSKGNGAPRVHAQGGPKSHTGSKVQGGPKVHAQGPKSKTSAPAAGGKKTQKAVATTATTSTNTNKSKTTTTTSATTGSTTKLTPVQQKLQRNTNLARKLQSRLPAGTDMMQAAAGFRNLGQFVAAVNVSNNLGLSFTDVKTRMVDDGMSLGQTIQVLRPTANTTTEVNRAETDANKLITTTEADASKKTRKSRG